MTERDTSDIPLAYALEPEDWRTIAKNGITWTRPSAATQWQVLVTDRSGRTAMGRTLAQAIHKLGYPLIGAR